MKSGLVVIGTSSGGLQALREVLPILPKDFRWPIVALQHQHPDAEDFLVRTLSTRCHLQVKLAEEGEALSPGVVYIAPPDRQLILKEGPQVSLSNEGLASNRRPSIDSLFKSAANVGGGSVVGVILTGGNQDGALGLRHIKACGGRAIVQDPESAASREMPESAIGSAEIDHVVRLNQIGPVLWDLQREPHAQYAREEG